MLPVELNSHFIVKFLIMIHKDEVAILFLPSLQFLKGNAFENILGTFFDRRSSFPELIKFPSYASEQNV